jgi:hypothetical protein
MGMTDKLWDALTTVIKMNDNVMSMAGRLDGQQKKIEDLTARVIRLETALEIAMAPAPRRALPRRDADDPE